MAPTSPLRIAVLECDTPLAGTQKRYGGYGGVFSSLLNKGNEALAQEEPEKEKRELEITTFDVVNAEVYPGIEDVDAVLLTGSRQNAFDNAPWIHTLIAFVQKILAQSRVRLIGVCFGHQIIGRALGAKVDRSDKGWEMSVTPVQLTEEGRRIFGVQDMSIFQMHRDIVFDMPAGVAQLARSPRCENQGMYARGRLITVQGHPEFTREIVEELLTARHASGVFDDGMYEDGMKRVGAEHGGVVVAKAFLRFAMEE